MATPKKKTVTKKKAPAAVKKTISKKKTTGKATPAKKNPSTKKPVAKISVKIKKKAVPKNKTEAKKVIMPKIETPVSKKQKETIRKNIAVHEIEHEKELIQSEQLSLPLPATEEKKKNKDFFKKIKGLRAVRNYDPHRIQLNKVRKGGPKPSGKKPLW